MEPIATFAPIQYVQYSIVLRAMFLDASILGVCGIIKKER